MNIELRDRTEETVRVYFNMTRDEEIQSLCPQKAKTEDEAVADFYETLSDNAKSYGRTIYIDGEYIGDIWCYCIDRDENPNAMVSYCIFKKEYWGRGIGSIALEMFLKEITEKFQLKSIGAFTYANNIGSIRVLEKNGFVLSESFEEDGTESSFYLLHV